MILIGITCYRTIHVRTAYCVIQTLIKHPETTVAFQDGVFVHKNANELVQFAQDKKVSHIFFVEHDIVYPPDTLSKLLAVDKDVVAAPYSWRLLPRTPLIYQLNPENDEIEQMSYDNFPTEPFKAFGVPTGCTLVKMSTFEKLEKPYFSFEYTMEGNMACSQDIYFSKHVNKAGMECWVEPTIKVTHIGDYDY